MGTFGNLRERGSINYRNGVASPVVQEEEGFFILFLFSVIVFV
jgi:hypothetical protein